MSESNIPVVTFDLQVSETTQAPLDSTLTVSGMAADAAAVGEAIAEARGALQDEIDDITTAFSGLAGSLFPVGSVIGTLSAVAPAFITGATWVEIMIPATWGDLEDGSRDYVDKTEDDTAGSLHFWRRTV